jgi:hypothetical protein
MYVLDSTRHISTAITQRNGQNELEIAAAQMRYEAHEMDLLRDLPSGSDTVVAIPRQEVGLT